MISNQNRIENEPSVCVLRSDGNAHNHLDVCILMRIEPNDIVNYTSIESKLTHVTALDVISSGAVQRAHRMHLEKVIAAMRWHG